MYFRACRKVSCGCCSLGFVVRGTLTVMLVLHVMDSYTATKVDMAGVTQVIASYYSTAAHSLLSEAFYTMISQRNTDQSETTIEWKTSEFSKASVKYQTKEKRSRITKNKDKIGVKPVISGYSLTSAHSLLSEAVDTMEGHRNTVQPENTIERKTSQIAKTSLKYNTKKETSTILNKEEEVPHFTRFENIHCIKHNYIGGKSATSPTECAGICEATEGCVAFVYYKRWDKFRKCWCKNKCDLIPMRKTRDTYIKVIDHIGCSVFDGKRSCYHLSQSVGNFSEMTQYCKELNMQMVVLETWREYKFIADKIKTDNMAINFHVSLKSVSGHYTWINPDGDTVQLDYGKQDPWAPNKPRYIQQQDCVYFWAIRLGKLDDFRCANDRFTICEHY